MSKWIMRLIDSTDTAKLAVAYARGRPPSYRYLLNFDVNAYGGLGHIKMTDQRSRAMRFDSYAAVFEAWKTQSTAKPLRPDGKPNRPLTAYSIEPEEVDT